MTAELGVDPIPRLAEDRADGVGDFPDASSGARRGNHWSPRNTARVPRIATGTTGTRACTAAVKPPR